MTRTFFLRGRQVAWVWVVSGEHADLALVQNARDEGRSHAVELVEDSFVGACEGEATKRGEGEPAARPCRAFPAGAKRHPKRVERDPIAGDRMPDGAKVNERARREPQSAACRFAEVGVIGQSVEVRKLPQVSVHDARRALADQESLAVLKDESGDPACRRSGAHAEAGQLFHPIFAASAAETL